MDEPLVPRNGFVGWNGGSVWSPKGRLFRFASLFLICLLTFGSYFSYDIPAAISASLQRFYIIDAYEYSLLYAVYSWPNTVLVLFGGVLMDNVLGLKWGAILFASLVLAGQAIFYVSALQKSFVLALIGRIVFGLGGESLGVAQSAFTAKFFRGNELAFAFGVALSFSRIGSAVNLNTEPAIVESGGVPLGLFVGMVLCAGSLMAAVLLGLFDRIAEKAGVVNARDKEQPPRISDIQYFSRPIWLIFAVCVSFYISVFTTIQFGSGFVSHRYGLSEEAASRVLSLPYLVSAGASPFLGLAVDYTGRALWWVGGSTLLLFLCLCGFYWFPPFPAYAYCLFVAIGVSYSVCAAAMWPCLAFEIQEKQLGTAYGLMNSIQNLGLAVAPLGLGYLLNETGSYKVLIFAIACFAAFSTCLAWLTIVADKNRGELLNANAADLKVILAKKQAAEDDARTIQATS